jgi:hypothetical protein
MPQVTVRHEINTDEDTYWGKIVFREDFNREVYVKHLGIGWELLDQKEDDAKLTRRIKVEPPVGEIPAVLKKMLTSTLSYVEDGTFDKAARRYTFKITPSLQPEKANIVGEVWLEKLGEKKIARVCRVSVDVKVFVVGSMIEERITARLKDSWGQAAQFANQYIAKNGL